MFYRVSEIRKSVCDLYERGIQKGNYVGFECLKDLYSVKLGYTTYVVGAPYSGKTEFMYEILINLSLFYGWKHALFSPESGSKEEIVAELCHKYIEKPFYGEYRMTEMERYKAEAWLDEYFFIIDPDDKDLAIPEFYKLVDEIENKYGVTIQTTVGDPFNEFKHNFSKDEGRQDLYIERILGDVRKNAKAKNRHNFIVTHCRDQKPITHDGVTYFPPPTARDYAGGQAWFRKGMAMVCIYRPPAGLNDENGQPYENNETQVIIQKSKPKGIGRNGIAKLFWDWKRSRYYEKYAGLDCYAMEEEKAKETKDLVPKIEYNPDKYIQSETEMPF